MGLLFSKKEIVILADDLIDMKNKVSNSSSYSFDQFGYDHCDYNGTKLNYLSSYGMNRKKNIVEKINVGWVVHVLDEDISMHEDKWREVLKAYTKHPFLLVYDLKRGEPTKEHKEYIEYLMNKFEIKDVIYINTLSNDTNAIFDWIDKNCSYF